jgi:hypothetical protein
VPRVETAPFLDAAAFAEVDPGQQRKVNTRLAQFRLVQSRAALVRRRSVAAAVLCLPDLGLDDDQDRKGDVRQSGGQQGRLASSSFRSERKQRQSADSTRREAERDDEENQVGSDARVAAAPLHGRKQAADYERRDGRAGDKPAQPGQQEQRQERHRIEQQEERELCHGRRDTAAALKIG